jgi:ubiquinone/menaquinone biosynthesis C-methylase UbiE
MFNLRKLYYALSPALRLKVRRLYYAPSDLMHQIMNKKDKIAPPRGLIFTGSGDFLNQGKRYVDIFVEQGGLQPHHHVLDIGSGIGRMAIPLASYLDKTARYEGFDLMKVGIDWCQANITPLYPNFNFTHVALKNDLYTDEGEAAEHFVFPYGEAQFDFCFLTSVFTHLTDKQVENYLREIRRVLKPNGKCLATFFVLNEQATPNSNPEFQFPYDFGHYRLMDEKVKSANVAYQESYLRQFSQEIDLPIVAFYAGFWSHQQKAKALDFQDILVFEKPKE